MKQELLSEIEKLEKAKTNLQRDVDSLLSRKSNLKLGIEEIEQQMEGSNKAMQKNKHLENESANNLKEAREEFKQELEEQEQQIDAIEQLKTKELDVFLEDLKQLRKQIEQEKLGYSGYADKIKARSAYLKIKEEQAREQDIRIKARIIALKKERSDIDKIKVDLKQLQESINDTIKEMENREVILKLSEQDKKTWEEQRKYFSEKARQWVQTINDKLPIVSAATKVLDKRLESIRYMFKEIEYEQQLLEEQRVSLNMAWREIKKLKE